MGYFPGSYQTRHKLFRLLGQIFTLVAGILVALLGAAAFLMTGVGVIVVKDMPKLFLVLPVFAFLGAMMLLLFLLGVKIIREAVSAMCDRSLDRVDLDKKPWMADPQWRNRKIVHRIGELFVLRYLWIVAVVLLLWIGVLGVLILPIRTLAIALSISGGIALLFGALYRSLEKRKVALRLRDVFVAVVLVSMILMSPFSWILIHPESEVGEVLLTTAATCGVFGYGGLLIYLYFRKRKFGVSICHLETLPAYVGGVLKAQVEIEFPRMKTGLPELPEGPVEVELQNRVPKESGRGVDVQWRTRNTVPIHCLIRPGDGTLRVPVEVPLPIEERGKMRGLGWCLEVRAPFPGVDYESYFHVPVCYPQPESTDLSRV